MVKTFHYDDNIQLTKHFNCQQFRCKCKTKHDFLVDTDLVNYLEKLYIALNASYARISSGFRCPDHDRAVGGKGTGKHTQGYAADITFANQNGDIINTKWVSCVAQDLGFRGIANINKEYTYIHLDMRPTGKWYGNEITGNNTVTDDFYKYYGISREEEPKMQLNGIDISACQQKIDWNKVTAQFVMIRAGFGRYLKQKDEMFETHYKNAKAKGIPVGAYWYSYAMDEEQAKQEAQVCIEVLKGKQFEYPIFYDMEVRKQFDLGRDKVDKIANAFCRALEAAGYWCGIYGGVELFQNLLYPETTKRFSLWYAGYCKTPLYKGDIGIWQYNVAGEIPANNPLGIDSVPGVTGKCDMDYGYVDYPSKIKAKGLNGFGPTPEPVPTPEPEPEPEPEKVIKMGDKGEDVKWMQTELAKAGALRKNEIDGSFGRITRGAVLEYQLEKGLPLTGICDEAMQNLLKQ